MNKIMDAINTKVVTAQGALMEVALKLDATGMSRDVLNELRDILADLEYGTRQLINDDANIWPQ